ncbi:DUF2490 domain-containing protein [Pontibacter sp. SGAir0037]|uniref:DUF2490 domain-containing protein n=1 Tax=Pontibacter sp. SGAir0037 TaxID=2571030 RepID=UPI0010CD4D05|nr:DUF2490 domain-containing protein [Pontibacter sp. SGAir0037]QCR23415.1 hypothetical protein C1N53_14435 [Pontibacter sp. SGAir0037]
MTKPYLILLLTLLPFFTEAQRKVTAASAIWPELQVNYGAGEDGILFFRNQYRINSDSRFNDLKETGLFSSFERVELELGYEHALTNHWRGGLSFRYAIEDYPKTGFAALFLRHNGSIGNLYFNKQGMFEYVTQEQQDAFGRVRFSAELGKRIAVKQRYITPAINYEAFIRTEFQKAESNAAERKIDRTRLRLNLTYEVNDKWRIMPYFMRQTDYYYVLIPPRYDENSQVVELGYTTKRNRISPVVALEIKYSIHTTPSTASITY